MEENTTVGQRYKDGVVIGLIAKARELFSPKDIMNANANGNSYDKGLLADDKEARRELVQQHLQNNGNDLDRSYGME